MLIHISSHQRVPEYIDQANHQEHGGSNTRIKSIDVGVEEQQIHADGLIDQILGQVTRTETNALQPREAVKPLSALRSELNLFIYNRCSLFVM